METAVKALNWELIMGLTKNQRNLLDFLKEKRAGEIVTEEEILRSTKWKPSTLSTYRTKNNLAGFLAVLQGNRYRIVRDGDTLAERQIEESFTQVRPDILMLVQGMEFKGVEDTYELVNYIGEGAVAHVWQAHARKSGENVALKVMNPRGDLLDSANLPNVRQRFSREARNSLKLDHPNVVRYRDSGSLKEHPFLVMDLADTSLASVLKLRALTLKESVNVVRSCALGLQYLHSQKCVHRDVKPLNMLRFSDRFVLGDLGIVRWPDLNPAFTSAGTITINSIRLGSWHYMAPEQRTSPHEAEAWSDVYSLGISWYEMLARQIPDPAAVGAGEFASPTDNLTVDRLIRVMLSYNHQKRPSVESVLQTLEDLEL